MDIGMKSAFAIFPLYFLTVRPKINLTKLFLFFVWGAVFSVLFYLTFSFTNYWHTGNLNKGVYFSFWMHRGYYTTYLVLGCTFILAEIVRKNRLEAKQIFVLLVLLAGVYFAEAKTGVSVLALLGFVLLLYKLSKRLSRPKFSLTLTIILIISSVLLTKLLTGNNRFAGAFNNIRKGELDITSIESTTARILMWETSLELIGENPFIGVGTGDIKDELQKRNYAKGYIGVAEENLNCHNQFFNSWLSLGILGCIALLGLFITLFTQKIGDSGFFIQGAAFLFFVTFLTESFLEVQAGIIPFAFLVSVIGMVGNKQS
jgi:O-antigen ligase